MAFCKTKQLNSENIKNMGTNIHFSFNMPHKLIDRHANYKHRHSKFLYNARSRNLILCQRFARTEYDDSLTLLMRKGIMIKGRSTRICQSFLRPLLALLPSECCNLNWVSRSLLPSTVRRPSHDDLAIGLYSHATMKFSQSNVY